MFTSVLYGATYQQFHHWDRNDTRGTSDALSYISMAHGNFDVSSLHKYRPLIPYAASLIMIPLQQAPLQKIFTVQKNVDQTAFYIVNFTITIGTALLFLAILKQIGFSWQLGLLGVMFLLTNRVTVITVGTPLVDSLYFFSIVLILYLMLAKKVSILACVCPLLVLSKETILPFLFLPLTFRDTRNTKMLFSIVISLAVFFVFRYVVDAHTGSALRPSQATMVSNLLSLSIQNLISLINPLRLHDLLNGFLFLALFAPCGYLINCRIQKYQIPQFILLILPISLFLAIISGNLGRMFFAGFVPLIVYSLVFIEFCMSSYRPLHW